MDNFCLIAFIPSIFLTIWLLIEIRKYIISKKKLKIISTRWEHYQDRDTKWGYETEDDYIQAIPTARSTTTYGHGCERDRARPGAGRGYGPDYYDDYYEDQYDSYEPERGPYPQRPRKSRDSKRPRSRDPYYENEDYYLRPPEPGRRPSPKGGIRPRSRQRRRGRSRRVGKSGRRRRPYR